MPHFGLMDTKDSLRSLKVRFEARLHIQGGKKDCDGKISLVL
jgi:hypothetical protein